MKLTSAFLILAASAFFACSDDTGTDPTPDAAVIPQCEPAGPAGACTTDSNFCEAQLMNAGAVSDQGMGPDNPGRIFSGGLLNSEATPDALELQLYAGLGAFPMQITTGTFEITGAELNFATCGVCPLILADLDAGGVATGGVYLATGGTVTITSLRPNLAFEVSDLTFEHVEIDPMNNFESTPHPDGCQSAISAATFDSPITYDTGM